MPVFVHMLQGTSGLSLADESFLWYGAQRVVAGDVPIRDFMAYDIGRYYWSAAVMKSLNSTGIVAMRVSDVLLQQVALLLATYLVMRRPSRPTLAFLILSIVTFMLWMLVNDFKAADYLASILLISGIAFVIEKPAPSRAFACGMLLGFAAVLGRNHGAYGVVASLCAIGYLAYSKRPQSPALLLAAGSAGVAVGYLPMIAALVSFTGMVDAYWELIKSTVEAKSTNMPLPWPRPWLARFDAQHYWPDELRHVIVGSLFILLPVFGLAGLVHVWRKRTPGSAPLNPVFVSAVLLTLPYVHYAFSRADIAHLSFGIFPLLIGGMTSPALSGAKARLILAVALCAATLFVVLPNQPKYHELREGNWQSIAIGRDTLKVDPGAAFQVSLVYTLADQYAQNGRPFVATWPGPYALLQRRSPTWEIYALTPRSASFQMAEIERIKAANPGFVIITDWAVNREEKYRYGNTHQLIDRYFNEAFRPFSEIEVSPYIRLRIRRPIGDLTSSDK